LGKVAGLGLVPPAPNAADHALADFDCGEVSLNEWLKRRALKKIPAAPGFSI
jgi:hypothetical protein